MKAPLYNTKQNKLSTTDVPEEIFGVSWNPDLVHQAIVAQRANARQPVAHAKERDERQGGGRKPWRQKGTGRARHGSIRSPLWKKGGVTFGPRNERNFSKSLNKKMKKQARNSLLTAKMNDGEIIFVDNLEFDKPSTKEARAILESISEHKEYVDMRPDQGRSVLLVLPQADENAFKSWRNLDNVTVKSISEVNVLDFAEHMYVIFVVPEAVTEQFS